MRFIVTILWGIAALCWLPWSLVLIRLLVDIGLGQAPLDSQYLPLVVQGLWPRWQILGIWYVHSWFPVCAFLGMALTATGWRLYWINEGERLTRPVPQVVLSILVPPYALYLMFDDARRRHNARELELANEAEDAVLRISLKH
jgi:hypothetical protein